MTIPYFYWLFIFALVKWSSFTFSQYLTKDNTRNLNDNSIQLFNKKFSLIEQLLSKSEIDFDLLMKYLDEEIQIFPDHFECNQLLGALNLQINNNLIGIKYLEKALLINNFQNVLVISNLIEAYRREYKFNEAQILAKKAIKIKPSDAASGKKFGI